MIDEVVSERVEQGGEKPVLDLLLNVVGKIVLILAGRCGFHAGDFSRTSRFGLEDFSLMIRTDDVVERMLWGGGFVGGTDRPNAVVSLQN